MKLLLTTIAAVVLVGCGESQQSAPAPVEVKPAEPVAEVPSQPSPPPAESKPAEPVAEASQPVPPKAEAPDIGIYIAANEGNIEAVKQHIAAGTDVNAKDIQGYTPLHHAANGGHKEIADLLIANGADVNAKSDWRLATPLDAAISRKHPEIIALLRKHGGKTYGWLAADQFFHTAARVGHIEAVKRHLAAGANVNVKDGSKWTPLHEAAKAGRTEVAELLIAEGANVNAKTRSGDTPLDWAIINDETETTDLLRKHGGKTAEELKAE